MFAIPNNNRIVLFSTLVLIAITATLALTMISSLDREWTLVGFITLTFPFVIILLPKIRLVLQGLAIFFITIPLDLHLFWHPNMGGAESIRVGVFEILFLVLLIEWVIRASGSKSVAEIKFFPRISLPTLALILVSAISMLQAQDLLAAAFDIFEMCKSLVFFLYIANHITNIKQLYILMFFFFLGVFAQLGVFLLQYYTAVDIPIPGYTREAYAGIVYKSNGIVAPRPGGTIGNVNSFSRYLLYFLPISVALSLSSLKIRFKWFIHLLSLLGFAVLIMSLTRSAWMGFFFAFFTILFIFFFNKEFSLKSVINLSFVGVFFLLTLMGFSNVIKERLTNFESGSAETRITTSITAWKMFKDYPIWGVGINNYESHLEKYWLLRDPFTKKSAVHNNYLLYLVELGSVGFIAYLWLLGAMFIRIRKAMQSRIRSLRVMAIGLMGSYIGFLFSSLADFLKGNDILILLFWVIVAFAEGINYLNARYAKEFYQALETGRWWNAVR
jgi:O-antigen ligase